MYDFLIVGSGLFGATFAREATVAGYKCLVIDKRSHLGGNVYCENIEGINVHKYGPHIFHTSNKEVWDYVNAIVPFNRFTHCPVALSHGKLYNLPFNMNTFNRLWAVTSPEEALAILDRQRSQAREAMLADGAKEPRNLEEQALCLAGKDVYETLIKEYTEKQWGRKCTELPASIIRRLPLRLVYDNNYFDDPWQGIPVGGYNKLVEGLLKDVECKTGIDFFHSQYYEWRKYARKLVYTGPLDEYFGFRLGRLQWRSVSFRTRVMDIPNWQGNAVVNYTTHEQPYTRVIEHKHFEMFGNAVYECPKTVVSEEYPAEHQTGMEPFYPVNDEKNDALAAKYRDLAEREEGVIFGGRLAEYKYYDMAPVMERALAVFRSGGSRNRPDETVPLISVIVPVYNIENYLPRCLDSIVNQTYKNLEIILVDDGSVDGSGRICDEYAGRDGRIRVIHQENGTLPRARNSGLKAASGDYIIMPDGDDVTHPQMIEFLYKAIISGDYDFSMCRGRKVYNPDQISLAGRNVDLSAAVELDQGICMKLLYLGHFEDACYGVVWNKLYKRELLEGLLFSVTSAEDLEYNNRVFQRVKKAVLLPEVLYYWVKRQGSNSNNGADLWFVNAILSYSFSLNAIPKDNELYRSYCLRRMYRSMATIRYWSGRSSFHNLAVKHCRTILKETTGEFLRNRHIPVWEKFIFIIFNYLPSTYHIFVRVSK
ncbi:MAG: UDP-galactopyranose mutase [Bacteroidales bacterium]|nr:UDP-galactopyranose mutase [Bacteroidales bacterium]